MTGTGLHVWKTVMVLALLAIGVSAAAAQNYTIHDLGSLGGANTAAFRHQHVRRRCRRVGDRRRIRSRLPVEGRRDDST